MFILPQLQPCDGSPVWVVSEDDLIDGLVLWFPAGTTWVYSHGEGNGEE